MSEESKKIALQRIRTLFDQAVKIVDVRPDLAQKYVEYARKIAMRTRIRLHKEHMLLICGNCKRFIFPGVNCRVRMQSSRQSHVVITCLHCGEHMRIPTKRKRRYAKTKESPKQAFDHRKNHDVDR